MCQCTHWESDEERRNTVFITELRQIANYYMGGKTMSDENVGMSGLTGSEASELIEVDGKIDQSVLTKVRELPQVVRADYLQFTP